MQKSSIKKLSILGLVLVAASAVTAAVLPKDNSKSDFANTDVLVQDSTSPANGKTCVEGNGLQCDATAASSTTDGAGSSTSNTAVTAASGNTTGDGRGN
jgi:hypothetical protein